MDTTTRRRRLARRWGAALALALASSAAPAMADPMPVPAVVDLHVDLPYALHTRKHAFDHPGAPTSPARLARGQAGTLVFPLFVLDAHAMRPEQARRAYQAVFEALLRGLQSPAGRRAISLPGQPAAPSTIASVLSFEGADGFSDKPEEIVPWIRKGACFVGLVHRQNNALAGSSTDPDKRRRLLGLTAQGKALAEIVVTHGGVLDGAHASDAAVDDMLVIARKHGAPVVVTHTGTRALRPIERNVDDLRMAAIAATGGVVGIDLHSGHIGSQPGMTATLDDVVAHLEHAVQVAGVDHVAIGSDLEGGITEPSDADGAATWPLLLKKLTERGWDGESIEAVFRTNAARVLGWAQARGCGVSSPR